METPDELGTTCKDPECRKAPEVAGWCPGHAIARCRRQAVRETPERYLSYGRRQALKNDE
jgi:hypothetical protein